MTDVSGDFLTTMAIGDSYGMKYEFVRHHRNKTAADFFHASHPRFTDYQKGRYTDDTQMSLANMELLLAKTTGGRLQDISDDEFVSAWLRAFKRDPHQGYSKRMWWALSSAQTTQDFVSKIDPSQATTSGAAMRAGPFGLLSDIEDVKRLSKQQAKITHATTAGIYSAQAVALTVHFFHHGGARNCLEEFLAKNIDRSWNSPESGNDGDAKSGLVIVSDALQAVLQAKTLSDVLLFVVNQKTVSDTDTTCAIAMVMAARCAEIKNDLPDQLYQTLENAAYGRDYLRRLDAQALTALPASNRYRPPQGRKNTFNPPRV